MVYKGQSLDLSESEGVELDDDGDDTCDADGEAAEDYQAWLASREGQ